MRDDWPGTIPPHSTAFKVTMAAAIVAAGVLAAGLIVPTTMSNGVLQQPPALRAAAADALREAAESCLSDGTPAMLSRAMRVVEMTPGLGSQEGAVANHRVVVDVYTVFGVRYKSITVGVPSGTICRYVPALQPMDET